MNGPSLHVWAIDKVTLCGLCLPYWWMELSSGLPPRSSVAVLVCSVLSLGGKKKLLRIFPNFWCYHLKKVVGFSLPGYVFMQRVLFRCSGSVCCPSLISLFWQGAQVVLLCYCVCITLSWFENRWAAIGTWRVLYRLVCCVMVGAVTECSQRIHKSWANVPGDGAWPLISEGTISGNPCPEGL